MNRRLLAILLLASIASAVVIPDKNYIEVNYTIGGSQPEPVTITFNNTEDETVDVTLSKSGVAAQWITLSKENFTLVNQSSDSVTVSFAIAANQAGTYTAYIELSPQDKFIYDSIPIYISVSAAQQQCILTPVPYADYPTIQVGTPPFEKTYSVRVGSGCTGGVDITNVYLTGTVQTPDGEKPVRLSGSQNLGFKQPGEVATFTLLYDISGLEKRTYNVVAQVVGTYNGEPISVEIPLVITVTGVAVPGNASQFQLPSCTIPQNLHVNETYEFICNDVSPNVEVLPQYNEYLVGISVETPADQFIYKFKPIKEGETEFVAIFAYNGVPIGEAFRKKLTITLPGTAFYGRGNLTFVFFPSLNELRPGDTLVVQCRDSKTNTIVHDCKLYVNGIEDPDMKFVVESGKTYFLSLDAPGYLTVDKTIEMPVPGLKIFLTPDKPVVGDYVTITVKDNLTNQNVNATLYLDGSLLEGNSFLAEEEGNHTIRAVAEGYEEASLSFYIEPAVSIKFAPEKISLGENVTLMLTKSVDWYVIYQESPGKKGAKVAEGKGETVSFIPEKEGYYSVFAENSKLYTYKVEAFSLAKLFGGISIPNWVWIAIVGIVFAIFLLRRRSARPTIRLGGGGGVEVTEE